MLLAGIYSVCMDSRLKTSGMTTITVIIYWDWYNAPHCVGFISCTFLKDEITLIATLYN